MFAKTQKLSSKKEDEISLGISMFQTDVIKILRMNPEYRKDEEIKRLLDFLTFFEVFKEFKNLDGLKTICEIAEYRFVELGDFVFKQGDPPEYFYILIKGEVSGSVKKVKAPQTKFLDEVDVIFKLQYGKGFGELALIENINRTASLTATKSAHLMIIPRQGYINIIRSHHLQIAEKNVDLLDEIRLFDNFTEQNKHKFTSFCYENTFPSYTTLLTQDSVINKLIIIKTGIINMHRHIYLANISPYIIGKYAQEISGTSFPLKFKVGSLGNRDFIGISEFMSKEKARFEYEVYIPSRIIEISTSDFLREDDFQNSLNMDSLKINFPNDDILLQEYFERIKWSKFQKSYSQKVVMEKKMLKLNGLRATDRDDHQILIPGKNFTEKNSSEKIKQNLNKINVRIQLYIEGVKDNLPMIATTKNHVALYQIMNIKNTRNIKKHGLGIARILNQDN